jgi:protein TonB
MAAMRMPVFSENDTFSLTLLLALLLHTALLGITFEFEDRPQQRLQRALEITLVHHPRPKEQNDKADYLAQTSQQGGGEKAEKQPPKTEQAPPQPEAPPAPVQLQAGAPPEATPSPASVRKNLQAKPKPTRPRQPESRPTTRAGLLLASRDLEIQRLTAELDEKMDVFSKRPRRKFVSASTQEYKYAAYLQAWRKKVEKVGTLNFPDEAKRNRLYGNLVLLVSLNSDGTIHRIELRKSSGHKVLDDAAIRIVRLAAPFAPFPANIAEETDILDITRTWQFVSGQPLFKTN